MATGDRFHVSVVTPERAVLESEARFVAFPAHDGEIGILRGRAPLLCRLGIGELRVKTEAGTQALFIDGGFAQMVDDRLTILTEDARELGELKPEEAREALSAAREMDVTDERSFEARQRALERARSMGRIAG